MSFLCELCGAVYEWKMFFNNHMRTVHGVRVSVERKRCKMEAKTKDFLEGYYSYTCKQPALSGIQELALFLGVKKETVYWWFFNKRQKDRRSCEHAQHPKN